MEEVAATKIEDGEPISKHPLFGGQGIMQYSKCNDKGSVARKVGRWR